MPTITLPLAEIHRESQEPCAGDARRRLVTERRGDAAVFEHSTELGDFRVAAVHRKADVSETPLTKRRPDDPTTTAPFAETASADPIRRQAFPGCADLSRPSEREAYLFYCH